MNLDVVTLRRHLAGAAQAPAVAGDEGAGERERADLKAASVLVPIIAHAGSLTVLFTRRTAHLRNHSGQISFPGGRAEPADATPEATALRETHEEIGLGPDRVEIVSRLPDYVTRTGYRVAPIIGIVSPPLRLRPDSREVAEIFEVPLAFLLDIRNHRRESRVMNGETRWFYAISYGEHHIWGATAGMVVNFQRTLTASMSGDMLSFDPLAPQRR